MITRKQYPNHRVYEMEIGGRPFTVETGKVAELANAECICRYGDTVVLTTCTCNPIPKAGIDYFPLTIEFEERMYSVGRIPGSFNRREGKPSERGILNSRIIDRPMRPSSTRSCATTPSLPAPCWLPMMITPLRSLLLWALPSPSQLPTCLGTAPWPPPTWPMWTASIS